MMCVYNYFKKGKKLFALFILCSLLFSLVAEEASPLVPQESSIGITDGSLISSDTSKSQEYPVDSSKEAESVLSKDVTLQPPDFQNQPTLPQIRKPTPLNHVLAFGEALTSNVALALINRYIRKAPYAYISWDSIYKNLTNSWVWDQDEFAVNHFGHPYQGSYYYIAGAANNLPFWESALVTITGSATWELFAETETPSYNDIIATTMGGIALGEILHRLHFATKSMPILSFLLSPMDSINTLITGKPANTPNGSIYAMDTTMLFGFMADSLTIAGNTYSGEKIFRPFYLGAGIHLIYGDPYALVTTTPFTHFTLNLKGSIAKDYYDVSLFTDGVLLSFAPWERKNIKTTMGLTLHYDAIISSDLNYSANSLAFTTKQNINLPHNWNIQWNTHLNWIVLSASDFYFLFSGVIPNPTPDVENRLYDLGTGLGTKLYFSVSQPLFGTFSFFYLFNALWTVKPSLPKGGSAGNSLIGMGNVSYEHKIFGNTSLGIEYSSYLKNAHYETADNTFEFNQFLNFFVRTRY